MKVFQKLPIYLSTICLSVDQLRFLPEMKLLFKLTFLEAAKGIAVEDAAEVGTTGRPGWWHPEVGRPLSEYEIRRMNERLHQRNSCGPLVAGKVTTKDTRSLVTTARSRLHSATVLYSAVQCSTVQCSAVQRSVVQ